MDMEEVMWGRVMTEQVEEEEEEEEELGSRVVARCSLSVSTSMESRRTWAVLRGCRSFWTAVGGAEGENEKEPGGGWWRWGGAEGGGGGEGCVSFSSCKLFGNVFD